MKKPPCNIIKSITAGIFWQKTRNILKENIQWTNFSSVYIRYAYNGCLLLCGNNGPYLSRLSWCNLCAIELKLGKKKGSDSLENATQQRCSRWHVEWELWSRGSFIMPLAWIQHGASHNSLWGNKAGRQNYHR